MANVTPTKAVINPEDACAVARMLRVFICELRCSG